MTENSILKWEDRLVRLSVGLLILATAYGIVAGAAVAMYYDVVPGMGALEDDLGGIQAILYLTAILVGLIHLPLAVADIGGRRWKPAIARSAAFIGPLMVVLGAQGLVSHLLWWAPISDADRFHILHHAVIAGAPLSLGFWLVLRLCWRPATFTAPPVPRAAVIASGIGGLILLLALSVLLGGLSLEIVGPIAIATVLIALLIPRPAR